MKEEANTTKWLTEGSSNSYDKNSINSDSTADSTHKPGQDAVHTRCEPALANYNGHTSMEVNGTLFNLNMGCNRFISEKIVALNKLSAVPT